MKITRHSALLTCRLFRTFLTFIINAVLHPTFIRKLCYKLSSIVTFTFIQIFIKIVPSLLNGIRVVAFAWYNVKIRVIFGVRSERRKVDKKSKPTWKLKHANSVLESFEYFCQMSSKLILTILSYTISKLVHFLRHSVELGQEFCAVSVACCSYMLIWTDVFWHIIDM